MTLADAQFSLAKVLRPFPNFEQVYQGQEAGIPIAFPGTLDADAGTPGFSPYLLAGLEVPVGAKVLIYFPVVAYGGELTPDGPITTSYTYQLHWRMRNVADFRRRRKPYHLSKQTGGPQDTVLTPPGFSADRLLIPSALETVLYQQLEPNGAPANANLRADTVTVPGDGIPTVSGFGAPLLPPGTPLAPGGLTPYGQFEQGVANPGLVQEGTKSLFRSLFTIAKGDELIITTVRTNIQENANWDFADPFADQGFSNLYGVNSGGPTHAPFPDLGIYVLVGTNPS